MEMRKNYMSVMLSGWTEWQFNKNWEPTTQKPLDFQSAAGVIGDNAWWCGVLLSDGFLPVGVREQEVLHKLRAAWTLASQEASIEMSYLHTNLPL